MSSLIRWEPLSGFGLRNAMDRLFQDSLVFPSGWANAAFATDVAMDVYETPEHVVVQAALPGVKPEQVEITVEGDTLMIRGEVREEKEVKQTQYISRERRSGSFARCVTLPHGLESARAEAEFENGVLTVRLPKSDQAKPKTVKIKAK